MVDGGLYIHFPWCVKKCPYCDFNSHPLRDDVDQGVYLRALLQDWDLQQRIFHPDFAERPFKTVFLGGGTPSLFHVQHVNQLLELTAGGADEVTMELNPGAREYGDLAAYRQAGVNRLSIGAQSFENPMLQALGRIHDADQTLTAFEVARASGFNNINVDLMWGLPGQEVAQALSDLRQAIALEPEHISWYQLTIEAKTEFAKRPPLLPVDRTLLDIEQAGLELLEAEGYRRYEISSFAKPGRECLHNLNYWSFGDYVGLGAGAHGKLTHRGRRLRTRQASQPRLYQSDPERLGVQDIAEDELALEFMMNALRLVQGVDQASFVSRTGLPWSSIAPTWQALVEQGLVHAQHCGTTPMGLRYLDSVLTSFVTTR